jgi:hypothetical protein
MPFEWLQPRVPTQWRARWPERAREAAREAIREQAALLMRLGRSRAEAAARCRQNLQWEFELHGRPALQDEVQSLVDEVYRRTRTLDPQSAPSKRGS